MYVHGGKCQVNLCSLLMPSYVRSLRKVGDLISQWLCTQPSSEKWSPLNGINFALEVILSPPCNQKPRVTNTQRLHEARSG